MKFIDYLFLFLKSKEIKWSLLRSPAVTVVVILPCFNYWAIDSFLAELGIIKEIHTGKAIPLLILATMLAYVYINKKLRTDNPVEELKKYKKSTKYWAILYVTLSLLGFVAATMINHTKAYLPTNVLWNSDIVR